MIYGSVCSGIEAASVAWHPLGWRAAFLSEIDAFPRAVLGHHYPDVPLHGDFTTIEADHYESVDLLVGGTPCQSFSVAGLRGGLDDDRGNLALEFLRLARRLRPRWVVWENVPGVLSSNRGRDFGAILGGLVELGYGFAYRVLDAQFFGVPQRRRRVFVVGCLGGWRPAVAVLFERHSLSGHPAPRREKGQGVASCVGASASYDRGDGTDPLIVHALRGEGFDASEDGTGRGTPLVAIAIQERAISENLDAGPQGKGYQEDVSYTLEARHHVQAVAFDTTQITSPENRCDPQPGDPCHPLAARGHVPAIAFDCKASSSHMSQPIEELSPTLRSMAGARANGGGQLAVSTATVVRRLTPRECERLQGFPDDYTLVPYRNNFAAAGPRYKALGNSMAVPVMRWIGERIQAVECVA